MSFAENLREEGTFTRTENGALALNTTGNACLDLFGTIGSLRNADTNRIETLFSEAYREDPLLATKIVFYARDIREGLGERRVFYILLKYMANYHPEALHGNVCLIGEYGRWNDLYQLIDTPLENLMWDIMGIQFEEDRENFENGKPISLLAKWICKPNTARKRSKMLGKLTAKKLGYTEYNFNRIVEKMRKYLNITEISMSKNQWDKIQYSSVPSRAMMIYRNAFQRHDADRFSEFTKKALTGEEKINSSTLYPYDIAEKFLYHKYSMKDSERDVLEAQWRQLPNYVEEGQNVLIMADTSGSMTCNGGRPLATSIGLAIYFAERNVGDYHNLFMTFSMSPEIVTLKGETLLQKIEHARKSNWGMNTNLEKAFELILSIAVRNETPQNEMPKSLVVISDMEIDEASSYNEWSFYDEMNHRFAEAGYQIPNIIFWNVNSRHDVFHADAKRKGVILCSGQSITTFKQLIGSIDCTPVEFMNKVINSKRYEQITIS